MKRDCCQKDQTVGKKKGKEKDKKAQYLCPDRKKDQRDVLRVEARHLAYASAALKATGVVIGIVLLFLIVVTAVNSGFTALLNLLSPARG